MTDKKNPYHISLFKLKFSVKEHNKNAKKFDKKEKSEKAKIKKIRKFKSFFKKLMKKYYWL